MDLVRRSVRRPYDDVACIRQICGLRHYAPVNIREDIPREDNAERPYDSGLREFSEMSDALKDIDVPNSPEDQDLYRVYVNAVQSLPSQPDTAFSSHNFDICDVLNDKQFLHGHYIHFCRMVRKNASALRCRIPYFAYLTDSRKIFSRPLHPCSCLFSG